MRRVLINDKILNPFTIFFILLFWIITFFIFYQQEIKPYIISSDKVGYKRIIPEDLLIEDDWKSIYFNEVKIGFSHTYLRVTSKNGQGSYVIENVTMINVPFGLANTKLSFHSVARLSSTRRLKNFRLSLNMGEYSTKVWGEVIGGRKLKITQKSSGSKRVYNLEVPENLVLSTFFEPTIRFGDISLNRKFSFTVFNPIFMKKEEVKVHVKELRETPEGKFFILDLNFQNFDYTLWVNQEGQIVKEISPIGIKIVKVTQTEAVKDLDKVYKKTSIRDNFSIPVEIDYSDFRQLKMLKVKLKNVNPDIFNLPIANQSILDSNGNSITLKIQKMNLAPIRRESALMKQKFSKQMDELNQYLEPTSYIQTNDSDIINLSKKIILQSQPANNFAKIKSILKWIHSNIKQLPTFSIPSAVQVLRTKVGDCNEITYLFAALARASHIPTKIITGLVYLNHRFRYHMWAEVFINKQWISVDPTLHQFPADVTHIGLIQGGYEQQLNLVKIISKMDIEIVGYKKDD